mmetsp:Transcript_8683/g.18802  ORF Transcript_8683/g.18802 Transcript_8683/m.18802 type:complete len:142 (+) Transcript_8683:209-634(+)|eukprot:CAMPEP_0168817176 /NCGR_PEP_ID=MMETSP0726-20121227/7097_1 /TAXON_ID=265536 /ORGANISM="Amphiprora sp., Strain CCMP467" /LENGTH=141 /DNA_ID=CAMNT_0008869445 /DNA_START=99 /DNA_END=527 /DNA_ORIENTATION=+
MMSNDEQIKPLLPVHHVVILLETKNLLLEEEEERKLTAGEQRRYLQQHYNNKQRGACRMRVSSARSAPLCLGATRTYPRRGRQPPAGKPTTMIGGSCDFLFVDGSRLSEITFNLFRRLKTRASHWSINNSLLGSSRGSNDL